MPYLLQNNQNRVENIKKKFENCLLDEKDYNNPSKNCNSFNSVVNTSSIQVSRSGYLRNESENNEKLNAPDVKHQLKTDVNKGDGKAVVRRSPAFRREKLNYGKNVMNTVNNTDNSHDRKRNNTANPQSTKPADIPIAAVNENISKNVTEEELSKSLASKSNVQNDHITQLITKPTFLIKQDGDKISKNFMNDQMLEQCPVINKTATGKNELKLTDSIRLALKAPLPKGPPPKKPPRTFVHTLQASTALLSNQNSILKTKEDPTLRLKLEKMENVIKGLDTRRCVDATWETIKIKPDSFSVKAQDSIEVKSSAQGKAVDIFSVKNLNCISFGDYDKSVAYDKEPERQSSFYIDCPKDGKDCIKTDVKNSFLGKSVSCEVVQRRCGSEPIYDLPCIAKKSSFESFGKVTKEVGCNESQRAQLHYMCTDVVNSVQEPKSASFSPLLQTAGSFAGDDHVDMKILFHKPQMIKKGCPESANVVQERGGIGKEDVKLIMNSVFGISDRTCSNKHCDADADSDSESTCSGLEEPNITEAAQMRKIPDGRHVHKCNNRIVLSPATASRKTYVKRVSSKLLSHSPYTRNLRNDSFSHLFESCILVGLTLGESKTTVPYIKSIFPSHVRPPPLIENLCFPDASTWSQSSCSLQQGEQYYSLVITNENGDRKFGYCRRVLPEGGNFCLPLVYCIISSHRANGFYYKILQELESRHGSAELQTFIEQIYECNFPSPGQSLKLKTILEEVTRVSPISGNDNLPSTIVRRPWDVRLEERDLSQLLQHLKISVFLKVFSSLLLERKVLLLGHSLRSLSCCIEALQSLLVPFSWQHTFIPVLPNNLNEMCDAPTPYVIGVQKSTITPEFLMNCNFEEGIMVDLEESHIIKSCGDEGSIIPHRLTKGLKTALNLALSASLESDNDRNVLISEAFIRFFVEICGNYSQFIVKQADGKKVFQKEEFVNSVPAIQSFLDWFVETAMFRSFIQDRLQNDVEDLFKRRALERMDEMEKGSALFPKNHKGVNRKVKTLGDRIKDLTLFSK